MNSASSEKRGTPVPTRREPPAFRRAKVRGISDLTPRMRRLVLGGPELRGWRIDEPAASVRLLLPATDGGLQMPRWTGNQFESTDGSRAPIRTFTPRRSDSGAGELTIDIVLHESGAASDWAAGAEPGDELAVSGPGRGYTIDTSATGYLLAGDETAIPAISQLLEELPASMPTTVILEIADPCARLALPARGSPEVTWVDLALGADPGDALVGAVASLEEVPPAVWVAGEAAAMQRIRAHLFDERGLSRAEATVRGYWKQGRSAT